MSVSLSYPAGIRKIGDVDGLLRRINISTTIEKRDIIQTLGEIKSKKSVIPLIELLEDETVIVRSSAAWALGEIGDAKATLPLIGLLNDGSDNVKVQAAWALGRISDMRAVAGLKSILKEAAPELKKIARESIIKLESINDENCQQKYNSRQAYSDLVDIPLLIIDVPSNGFECEYITRVEDGLKNGNGRGNGVNFSKDVIVDDTDSDSRSAGKNKRRITVGLKNAFDGLVSVDILFSYIDQNNAGHKSSVWLQLANNGHEYVMTEPGRNYKMPPLPEAGWYRDEQPAGTKKTLNELRIDTGSSTGTVYEEYQEQERNGAGCVQPEVPHVVNEPEPVPSVVPAPVHESDLNIDSVIGLLNNIGTSGMANAASTVTGLTGQDELIQSPLRIVQIDEMQNEITNLGEEIVLIDVQLHGNDPSVNISGNLMFYLSKDIALKIANELLCIPPDETINEFTEDIISTVKESANIFGGQYVSAISEFIQVPITLNAPIFKTGNSSEIAKNNMEEVAGEVEFALATDMNFGENKTGRLIILLDPKSFDTIIQKLL